MFCSIPSAVAATVGASPAAMVPATTMPAVVSIPSVVPWATPAPAATTVPVASSSLSKQGALILETLLVDRVSVEFVIITGASTVALVTFLGCAELTLVLSSKELIVVILFHRCSLFLRWLSIEIIGSGIKSSCEPGSISLSLLLLLSSSSLDNSDSSAGRCGGLSGHSHKRGRSLSTNTNHLRSKTGITSGSKLVEFVFWLLNLSNISGSLNSR